ncbi:MAG: HD domain-containing protein [Treponema sp.]|nr:HD domain-containing protein [Treponema sp.]
MKNSIKLQSKHKKTSIRFRRFLISICGIFVNVLLAFIMNKVGLPLYFDTLGTIGVAAITGYLFPAICTGVATNAICTLFYQPSIYLSFFNALIGIITVAFVKKYSFKKIGNVFLYALIIALISSLSVSFSQFAIYGENGTNLIAQNARAFASVTALPYLLSFCITTFLIYFLEKAFICIIMMILLHVIPKKFLSSFEDSFSNKILSDTEQQYLSNRHNDIKHPLHTRITSTFIIAATILVCVTGFIALRLYFDNSKKEKTEIALNCVKISADFIDPNKVDGFIKYGKDAPGYNETMTFLTNAWATSSVTYLYVIKTELDGARFIFDVEDPEGIEVAMKPGELLPYDKELEPFIDDLLSGKIVPPVESKSIFGKLITVTYPVYDDEGSTVCYVAADVSLDYLKSFIGSFIAKVFFVMAGFFLVIISYTIWTIGNNLSYPISTIAAYVDIFSDSVENQEKLEENAKQIRSLNIQTGDEIQKLYDAICRMTLSQTEQIRDIRRLSDSTVKMQDGLIITMADMVENRDSDTGAHIQKTAAYVKIIVEGLKKKGYYPQKITPKFMSDVVRSAPLHDVGKINIPDGVLNKPGKLTDEEFAIMKNHTTAGKEILEKAISSVQGENYLKEARNMAAYHHERWDGKGYPEGLHGEVIPLSARIMAVADVFDALCSPRVYKPAFPLEKSLAILQEGSGTQFDPKCVEVFMDSISEVKMILKKYNTTVVL